MKKLLLMFAAVVLAAQTTSAQTVEDSKFFDNWYLGVNTGLNAKTTHTVIFKNLNPSAGLRIGRYFTPVFGFAIEGEAYFNKKAFLCRVNKGICQIPKEIGEKGAGICMDSLEFVRCLAAERAGE